jgi:hypothetical protein
MSGKPHYSSRLTGKPVRAMAVWRTPIARKRRHLLIRLKGKVFRRAEKKVGVGFTS